VMNRRSFVGALAAAVVAPFLPKIATAQDPRNQKLTPEIAREAERQIRERLGDEFDEPLDFGYAPGLRFTPGTDGSLGRGTGTLYTRMSDGSIEAEAFDRSIGFDQLNL